MAQDRWPGSWVSSVWGRAPRQVTRASGARALDPDPTEWDVTQNTQISIDFPTCKRLEEEGVSSAPQSTPPPVPQFWGCLQVSGPLHVHLCQTLLHLLCSGDLSKVPCEKGVLQQNLLY